MVRTPLAIVVLGALACRPHVTPPPKKAQTIDDRAPPGEVQTIVLGARLPTHPEGIAAIAVHGEMVVAATEAPLEFDGRTIGTADPGVRVWHADGRLRAQFGDAHVLAIASLPGDRIATADVDGKVRVAALDGGSPREVATGARVAGLGWIPAREQLAIVRLDGEITLVGLGDAAQPTVVGKVASKVGFAAIGRTHAVLGTESGTVFAIDLATPAAALRAHDTAQRPITAVALAPDERSFVAGDMDGEVWRATIGGVATSIASRNGWPVRALAMMPSGHVVVSTSTQGQYLQVHAPGGRVEILPASDGPYDALAVDGARLVTGSRNGIVSAFDVAQRRELLDGPRNVSVPRAMAFGDAGTSLVTYARPDPLVWSLADGTARPLVAPETWPVAIVPSGARAIVTDGERSAWAWHDVGSDRMGPWQSRPGFELEIAFAGDVLGIAWHEGSQRDGAAGFELRRGDAAVASWRAEDHVGLRGFVAAPDGTRWASLDGDDRPHVWTPAGELVCRVDEARLNGEIVFGRDAGELVLASQSHGLEILDAARCTTLATIWEGDGDAPQGTSDAIWTLASAPAHGLLATGHGSGTVRMWTLVDRRERWSRREQTKLVERVLFDGAGRQLASAAQDGSLVVYRW